MRNTTSDHAYLLAFDFGAESLLLLDFVACLDDLDADNVVGLEVAALLVAAVVGLEVRVLLVVGLMV